MVSHETKETRQTILKAAFEEIRKKGFQAASLSQILSQTGLTKGALYHHFKSKKELGLALVKDVLFSEIRKAWVIPLNRSSDPVSTLIQIVEEKINTKCEKTLHNGCVLNNLTQEMSPVDEDFRLILQDGACEWLNAIESALVRGQKNGTVKGDVCPETVSRFIFATLEGTTTISKSFRCSDVRSGVLRELQGYIKGLSLIRF